MDAPIHDGTGEMRGGADTGEPAILEEIEVEDLAVDGICGVY
jgi:mycofactocin precursor